MTRFAISADSHINEDPNLWTDRLPSKYQDRAPKTIDLDNGGQGWWLEGITDEPIPLGLTAVAHRATKRYDRAHFKDRFKEYKDGYNNGLRYDEILQGSFRPEARIEEMDEDNVDAEILYQSPLIWPAIKSSNDKDLVRACFRTYNDWMAEFNSYSRERLFGPGLIPTTGVVDAIVEMRRCVNELGMRSVTLESYPNGSLTEGRPEVDDSFWAAAEELDVPVNIHIAFTVPMNAAKMFASGGKKLVVAMEQGSFRNVITNLILNGTFDRFPKLRIVGAEVMCGWIPLYFEHFDARYKRFHHWEGYNLELLPSEYWRRNCYATYVGGSDYIGVTDRYAAGLGNIMWCSDFPHSVSNWPIDLEIANDMLDKANASEQERERMMWKTAAETYKLDSYLNS